MAKTEAERRRHPRLPLSIPVFVRGVDEDGREFLDFATALNISASGILLASRRNLPRSASLSLEIPVSPLPPLATPSHSIRTLKARLVRLIHGDKCNLIGLKFNRVISQSPPKWRVKRKASSVR
jgi:hypothetical protein